MCFCVKHYSLVQSWKCELPALQCCWDWCRIWLACAGSVSVAQQPMHSKNFRDCCLLRMVNIKSKNKTREYPAYWVFWRWNGIAYLRYFSRHLTLVLNPTPLRFKLPDRLRSSSWILGCLGDLIFLVRCVSLSILYFILKIFIMNLKLELLKL